MITSIWSTTHLCAARIQGSIDRKIEVSCCREMQMSLAKVLVTFLFYIDTTFSENIEITRIIPNGKWKEGKDSFNMPQSVCNQDSEYGSYCGTVCKTVSGTGEGSYYSCSCTLTNATLTYQSNQWRCRENTEVRKQLGEGCFVCLCFFVGLGGGGGGEEGGYYYSPNKEHTKVLQSSSHLLEHL